MGAPPPYPRQREKSPLKSPICAAWMPREGIMRNRGAVRESMLQILSRKKLALPVKIRYYIIVSGISRREMLLWFIFAGSCGSSPST